MPSRPSGMRWSSATRARSLRWRCRSPTPRRWTRSPRRPGLRSIRYSATPRISKRRAAGSPRATAAKLARTRLLAGDAALGTAEKVADSGDGLDHVARFAVRSELSPQTAHIQLHEVSTDVRVIAPHALEDLLLREDASGVCHEMAQQLELGRREMHGHAVRADLVRRLVEDEIAGLVDRRRGSAARADRTAQDRLHPSDKLLRPERLGDVVVGPKLQGAEDVALVLARGEQ